jgi:hypothetical protein
MERYFFDIHDGVQLIDDEGIALSSLDEARIEALAFCGSFVRDEPHHLLQQDTIRVDIRKADGPVLDTLIVTARFLETRQAHRPERDPTNPRELQQVLAEERT